MQLSIFSLNAETLLEFLRLGLKLFNSIMADGKNVMLCLNNGNAAVLVTYDLRFIRTRLKSYFGSSFLKTLYKSDKVFCTNDEVEVILGLVLGRFFLLTYLEWLLLLLNRHYIEWTPFLCGKNY